MQQNPDLTSTKGLDCQLLYFDCIVSKKHYECSILPVCLTHVSAELLADQIVRLELLDKLSARYYETVQSVRKRYIGYHSP